MVFKVSQLKRILDEFLFPMLLNLKNGMKLYCQQATKNMSW